MGETKAKPRAGLLALMVLFSVLLVGEGYALLLQYQNNTFFQQYVTENYSQVLLRIIGLIALAAGAAYLAYLSAGAGPTTRVGRSTRKIIGLSPVILFIVALAIWPIVLSPLLGGSTTNFEIYVVVVLIILSAGMMLGDRITARMALRNFTRRKTSMAIVIAGLMIGTAMISGSLVTGDTLTELFTRGAYNGYGYADEVVYSLTPTSGYQFFNLSLSHSLYQSLSSNPAVSPNLLGVTPEILGTVSVVDSSNGVVQAGATLIGTYGNSSISLGEFRSSTGAIIPSNIADNEAILNDRAARDLNATVGDTIKVFSPLNESVSVSLKAVGIAVSDARGSFSGGDDVFLTMNSAQNLLGRHGSANFIAITNKGGLHDSVQHTSVVGLAANQTLNGLQQPPEGFACKTTPTMPGNSTTVLCAYGAKQVAVNNATDGAKNLSSFFIVLSTITIMAGVVLIVNIFVMLAEERKSEMGMARAVGMRRNQLTKLFLFEGSLYATAASLVGVFVGIGIAYAILYAFGRIISSFFPVSLGIVLESFTYTPTSLLTAFAEGLLITYFTILLTSWRVSKLNIIRAVRDIPEPPRGIRTYTVLLIGGFILAAVGILVFQLSFAAKSAAEALVGPSLVIFGSGFILARFILNRYAFTLIGIGILVQWGVPSLSFNNSLIQSYTFGPELFIAGGLIMVLGAVMLAMYNTDVILRAMRLFYRGRKTLTVVFRTALSYPGNKRFRTAATVAMFALVIFSVSAIALLAGEQSAALDTLIQRDSGGYDLITQTTLPVSNLTARLTADTALAGKLSAVLPFNNTLLLAKDLTSGRDFGYQLVAGADPLAQGPNNFFTTNTFNMVNMTSSYKTAAETWTAVTSNPSNVVWSFGFVNTMGPPTNVETPAPGDVIELLLQLPNQPPIVKRVTVVGILNGVFFGGILGTSRLLKDSFGVGAGNLGFVKVSSGIDPLSVSYTLKRDFARLGMQTTVIAVLVSDFVQVGQSFLGVFEGFLALGLVVGIAGLGIISIRSVTERRKEIGVLRALGFRRKMILATFLVENSYVALLGILIGVGLGIDLGYAIATSPGSNLSFVVPWVSLLEIIGFAYGLALLATLGSARRAARIPPAEALRYSE